MTDPFLKTIKVGVFEHQRKRSVQLAAYTLYYSPTWEGCCEHVVSAANGTAAKTQALREHRETCMANRETERREKI